jgi:hypothetical protein
MAKAPQYIVLGKGLSLIEDPQHWLRDNWKSEGPCGTQRCAYQAVVDAGEMLGIDPRKALELLAEALGYPRAEPRDAIMVVNDCHGHHAIIEGFRKALAGS